MGDWKPWWRWRRQLGQCRGMFTEDDGDMLYRYHARVSGGHHVTSSCTGPIMINILAVEIDGRLAVFARVPLLSEWHCTR
jgi:hypothetical protein